MMRALITLPIFVGFNFIGAILAKALMADAIFAASIGFVFGGLAWFVCSVIDDIRGGA